MGILIQKVRIQNFRSIKHIEVELTPLTLLVGANNAGKTSFLRALNLALGYEKRTVNKDDLFIDKNGQKLSQINGLNNDKIIVDVKIIPIDEANNKRIKEFDDDWVFEFKADNIQDENGDAFFAFRFQYIFEGGRDNAKSSWYRINDWDNPSINEEIDTLSTITLRQISLYFIDAQRDIQDDLRNRNSYFGRLATQIEYDDQTLNDLEAALTKLNDNAVASAEVLTHLKERLEELNSTLRTRGKGVEITPLPKKIRDLHKNMKIHFQDGDSEIFALEYHGVGTRSWASLLTFKAYVSWETSLRTPFYPILALEEPEAHLHPNAQRQLYRQLKDIEGQKIISTHSPYVVAQAELEEILYFSKASDETIVKKLNLTGITPDERRKIKREVIYSKGELMFSKAVILSEGKTEEQALPIFAKRYWGKEAFEIGVNFVGCGGSNYNPFIKVFESIGINWYLFSDYDNPTVKTKVDKELAKNGFSTPSTMPNVILLEKAFESYIVQEGYQEEVKKAIIPFIESYFPTQSRQIEEKEKIRIESYLIEFLEKHKTALVTAYSEEIAKTTDDNRAIPPKIRQLFEAIASKLNA